MSTVAVTFMIVSMTVIWGGLVTAVLLLRRDGRLVADAPDDAPHSTPDGPPGDGTRV